jgi:hypothetical protein
MTLEEEVSELLRRPLDGYVAAQKADPKGWFLSLSMDQRYEMFLLSLYGLAEAVKRLARAIDEGGVS